MRQLQAPRSQRPEPQSRSSQHAANTVAGTLSGWSLALEYSKEALAGKLPLSRLLADAIHYARHGIPVTRSQHATTAAKLDGLKDQPGFAETFTVNGEVPRVASLFCHPRMAATLQQLAAAGTVASSEDAAFR